MAGPGTSTVPRSRCCGGVHEQEGCKEEASLPTHTPKRLLSLPGAAAGVEGLSRGISVATMGAVALFQGNATQVSDVIQHSAWWKGQ